MKVVMLFIFLILISSFSISACGWASFDDIKETKFYYDGYDKLKGIEDSILLMSRFPSEQEIESNVYIPMSYIN